MSEPSETIKRVIRDSLGNLDPNPGPDLPSTSEPFSLAGPAIARCRDAWKQAYDAYLEKNARKDGSLLEHKAKMEAATAYRAATAQLAGYNHIRDFVACVAYGVLVDAIPSDRTGQLLYAAQTALSLLHRA
jgi:hypothetical protein